MGHKASVNKGLGASGCKAPNTHVINQSVPQASLNAVFRGLKNDLSYGCEECVLCGGKHSKWMMILSAKHNASSLPT
jgi:hypothetical protein